MENSVRLLSIYRRVNMIHNKLYYGLYTGIYIRDFITDYPFLTQYFALLFALCQCVMATAATTANSDELYL